MERVQQMDEEFFTDPNNDLADRLFQKRDAQAEREEKNFIRTTFADAMSPLKPSRVTNYGLLAYVLGAILGLGAALFALS